MVIFDRTKLLLTLSRSIADAYRGCRMLSLLNGRLVDAVTVVECSP